MCFDIFIHCYKNKVSNEGRIHQNHGYGNKFESSSTLHLNKNHDRIK